MTTEIFDCEDSYEAEKLAGLLTVQEGNTIYISGISAAVKNEIIFLLKDKSSHSVTLRDEENVWKLKYLVEDLVAGNKTIIECSYENLSNKVKISTK